jgi:hypothetical protein
MTTKFAMTKKFTNFERNFIYNLNTEFPCKHIYIINYKIATYISNENFFLYKLLTGSFQLGNLIEPLSIQYNLAEHASSSFLLQGYM